MSLVRNCFFRGLVLVCVSLVVALPAFGAGDKSALLALNKWEKFKRVVPLKAIKQIVEFNKKPYRLYLDLADCGLTSKNLPAVFRGIEPENLAKIEILNLQSNDLTTLEKGCFNGLTALGDLSLPDSLTKLEKGCFTGLDKLTNLEIAACKNLTTLKNNCFGLLKKLTTLWLPENFKKDDVLQQQVKESGVNTKIISYGHSYPNPFESK